MAAAAVALVLVTWGTALLQLAQAVVSAVAP
jgi:hypothetical protein